MVQKSELMTKALKKRLWEGKHSGHKVSGEVSWEAPAEQVRERPWDLENKQDGDEGREQHCSQREDYVQESGGMSASLKREHRAGPEWAQAGERKQRPAGNPEWMEQLSPQVSPFTEVNMARQ